MVSDALFVAITIPPPLEFVTLQNDAKEKATESGLEFDPTQHWHLSLQYCGDSITDEKLDEIRDIWLRALNEHDITSISSNSIFCGMPSLKFYGKDENMLVIECTVSSELTRCVAVARDRVSAAVPEVPPSDFAFHPHITAGEILPPERASDFGGVKARWIHPIVFVMNAVDLLGPADPSTGMYVRRAKIVLS